MKTYIDCRELGYNGLILFDFNKSNGETRGGTVINWDNGDFNMLLNNQDLDNYDIIKEFIEELYSMTRRDINNVVKLLNQLGFEKSLDLTILNK